MGGKDRGSRFKTKIKKNQNPPLAVDHRLPQGLHRFLIPCGSCRIKVLQDGHGTVLIIALLTAAEQSLCPRDSPGTARGDG